MYDDVFDKIDGVESVVFLLTEMKKRRVKAAVISGPDDPRLTNPQKAFGLISVDHFRLTEDDLELLGDVDPYIDSVGCAVLLKPRVYNRLTGHGDCDFFGALATANTDTILAMSPDLEWCTPEEAQKRQEEIEYEDLFGPEIGPDGLPIEEPDEDEIA